MLAVSTTWNFERHGRLEPAIREIQALGFAAVEIRAQGAAPDGAVAARTCIDSKIRCRSVHAPITPGPWTDGDPSRGLASLDESLRQRAVGAVLQTLPAAAAARAEVIVLHPGEVELPGAREHQAAWLAAAIRGDGPAENLAEVLAERRRLRDAHLDAAARSLFDLTRIAPEVLFALETRLYFHQIPDLDEVELLISDAGPGHVGYWHDTGHAHAQGRIGVADPLAWLDRHGGHTAGFHFHDMVGDTDHLPPGAGEVDWAGIRGYVASGAIRVMEVHGRHSSQELLQGADFLTGNALA